MRHYKSLTCIIFHITVLSLSLFLSIYLRWKYSMKFIWNTAFRVSQSFFLVFVYFWKKRKNKISFCSNDFMHTAHWARWAMNVIWYGSFAVVHCYHFTSFVIVVVVGVIFLFSRTKVFFPIYFIIRQGGKMFNIYIYVFRLSVGRWWDSPHLL